MHAMRRRTSGLLVHEVDSELLLLDTESDRVHQLNRTASFIWRSCEEHSPEEIARRVVDEFEVDFAVALRDVRAALSEFEALALVEPGSGDARHRFGSM